MLRTFAAVALATSVVAVSAPAQAQENTARPMGLRFELGWAGNSNLANLGRTDIGGQDVGFAGVSPTGDIKIGYDLGQFTPLVGLSLATTTVSLENDDSFTATAFILDIEARYYMKQHRKGLNPFIFGEFNHAFTSLSSDPEGDEDAQDDLASALDFTTINAGLGMEYKFDQSQFAIGGKWGLGIAFQGFDVGEDSTGVTTIGTLGAIYAAWRL
jgi:hypothetical protein